MVLTGVERIDELEQEGRPELECVRELNQQLPYHLHKRPQHSSGSSSNRRTGTPTSDQESDQERGQAPSSRLLLL